MPAGDQAPPIAIAGHDVIVQPGATVMLNGIESLPLGDAHITDYRWTLQSGDDSVKMEVRPNGSQGAGPTLGRVTNRISAGE